MKSCVPFFEVRVVDRVPAADPKEESTTAICSFFAILMFFLPMLFAGCGAPGSAITQPGISGRLVDGHGHGVANKRISLMLPAQYGLAGLDAVWGKPEDYGHRQQEDTVETDSDGRFNCLFPPTTYSIVLLLLPPLGVIPSQPPKPFIGLRTASVAPNSYLIGWEGDHLGYRIWDHGTGALRADSSQKVAGTFVLRKPAAHGYNQGQFGGWQAEITVRQ
jgi:hypothetical protein